MNSVTSILDCYPITPLFDLNNPSAKVTKDNQELVLSGPQIKWGITGTGKPSDFISIDPSKLIFFVYSPKNAPPTTLWVFKKINNASDPEIARAQKRFLRASSLCSNVENIENAITKYQESVKSLEKSSKIEDEDKRKEINKLLLLIKRDLFFLQMDYESELYLTNKESKKTFNEPIKNYKKTYFNDPKTIFDCFLQFIRSNREDQSPARCLTRAIIHEVLDHPLLAAEAYLQMLSQEIKNENICIDKIKSLITGEKNNKSESYFDFLENLDRDLLLSLQSKTKDPFFEKLLFEKDFTRMYFEACLEIIQEGSQRKNKSCFICFALETNVEKWLTKVFVPDLEKTGIRPIYGPWHLNHSEDLNTFQSKIRDSDLALVIGTSRLRKICIDRFQKDKAMTGAAQEIRIAQERYNDGDKYGTLFTLTLHGTRKDCIPTPILEPIFTSKLEVTEEKEDDLYEYYSKAFRIFACLGNITSKSAGELKEVFVKDAGKIVFDNEVTNDLIQQVQKWGEERYRPKFTLNFLQGS